MRALVFATVVVLAPSLAAAEQVFLKSGGRLEGVLLERSATRVVLQVGPGQVTLPTASIVRIVEGRSPLLAYSERAGRLQAADRDGWLELGMWARDAGLDTQAREAFAHVLARDPQNPIAQAGIGNVMLNGRWVTPEESYRSRGYLRFEGVWMLPEERDETIRDRAERRAELAARAESQARIAEAEAQARAAEAAARQIEAESSGIPLGYGGLGYFPYSGYGLGGYGNNRPGRGHGGGGDGGIGNGGPHPGHGQGEAARVPTSSRGAAPQRPQPAPTAQQGR